MNTQAVVDLTQSLGWILNQDKSELKPTQVFLFMGYEYHLDSALVKPTQERWLKLQNLILRLKSKHVLTARCLMSLIGLLASTEKMVPEGCLLMRPFQFHLKEHWTYPQSLDSLLPWTEAISAHLEWWQNPANVMRGADLHPIDHSIQLFTDAHLNQSSTKGLWSDREKRLHINFLELKAVSLALRSLKDQCQNQTVLVATDNSTVVAYINKQGGTHSAEMCALLWKIMTFSVEVAERIATPQRSSIWTIYKSKVALFEKWCRENSVDFSTPSVKQVSDFFMYLYQDLNRRPSTFDGYRTAIVDTLGPAGHIIAQSSDLHRLLSSFQRDRPKSSRNLPKWNLSVVLNELTKAPFEPMKDLKHLTLKTAFLLALASGKRRSKIHALVANKVSNLGQWEKVALFPSSDFIARNQLAREGSQSVSPVTIPALTTIVDRQFKEDRTLCPVRALRYYLDRTKDLRVSRSLLFISLKKGHTSDIRPTTLSSWLKQTILLCCKQADQQALDLVQV